MNMSSVITRKGTKIIMIEIIKNNIEFSKIIKKLNENFFQYFRNDSLDCATMRFQLNNSILAIPAKISAFAFT